jgi:hypothetical protein
VDLPTYLRVIWRFRLIVAAGFVLAVLLAVSSYAKITFHGGTPHLTYRQGETWEGATTLAVTPAASPLGTPAAATGFFSQLAYYYAGIANSDQVTTIVKKRTKFDGVIQATPVIDPTTRITLPFITIKALAATRHQAVVLANSVGDALTTYVQDQQQAAAVNSANRVTLRPINRAQIATLSTGRRKTTPVVIFLTVMIAAIGLAFLLENLRPRVHMVGRDTNDDAAEQRSA